MDIATQVQIVASNAEYDGYYRLQRYVLRIEQSAGVWSQPLMRLVFERGDSVAVLLYDRQHDSVLLVQQFRLPAYLREHGSGQLYEIVAGTVDSGRHAEDVARSELLEEAGYAVSSLVHIVQFYPSPGACSERIDLYLAELADAEKLAPGGGLPESGEDITMQWIPVGQALAMVSQGEIRDAKTIIALQHLALLRQETP